MPKEKDDGRNPWLSMGENTRFLKMAPYKALSVGCWVSARHKVGKEWKNLGKRTCMGEWWEKWGLKIFGKFSNLKLKICERLNCQSMAAAGLGPMLNTLLKSSGGSETHCCETCLQSGVKARKLNTPLSFLFLPFLPVLARSLDCFAFKTSDLHLM